MRLVRYGPAGEERPGLLDADGRLRDLSGAIRDVGGATLLPDAIAELQQLAVETLPLAGNAERIGPCVGGIGKIVCVGLNYRDHATESNMPVPSEPVLFLKASSAIVGPNDDIEIPPGAEKVDWEVELGVVIGKPGRYISVEHAFEHVAGYCVVNDVSEQRQQCGLVAGW